MNKTINNIQWHYVEEGQGVPLLCLHGYWVDHHLMKGCVEAALKGKKAYRRIYVDLPGMGQTPAGDSINCADDMLDELRHFVTEVIADEPFWLIGESYGGYLAHALARELSSQVKGLFLLCPAVIAKVEKRILPARRIKNKLPENEIASADRELYKDFLNMAAIAGKEPFTLYKRDILPGVQCADATFLEKFQQEGYALKNEDEILQCGYAGPGIILAGRQDDVVGYEDAWRMAQNMPCTSIMVIEDAGHNLQIERPDVFEAALQIWLDSTV